MYLSLRMLLLQAATVCLRKLDAMHVLPPLPPMQATPRVGLQNPRERGLGGKCKTKVGPCWRCFIQSNLSRGSHNTQPRKEHKIKEHNTGMTETRAARVE